MPVEDRRAAIADLVEDKKLVSVDLEGLRTHATPAFLALVDQSPIEPRVRFLAPLDQLMWDRKFVAHVYPSGK